MSASRGTGSRLSRKRKYDDCSQSQCETALHDITDDFQDMATVFRVPKLSNVERLLAPPRARGRPKRSGAGKTLSAKVDIRKAACDNEDFCDVASGSSSSDRDSQGVVVLEDNDFLLELEESVLCENEKLCGSCKHIVPSSVFTKHFKECMQKFRLSKQEACKVSSTPVNQENEKQKEKDTAAAEEKESQTVLPCPVCLKTLKSKAQRQSHLKGCAHSHGLSSEKLLQAVRLQEKQEEERNQLGLPLVVPQTSREQNKVKEATTTERSKKKSAGAAKSKDPDLAMALALSRSMAEEEAEKRASREEKLLALGLDQIVEEDRKAKPVVLLPLTSGAQKTSKAKEKSRGRKGRRNFRNTLLSTRTAEERERIISEKVASILTAEDVPSDGFQDRSRRGGCGRLAMFRDESCSLWASAHSHLECPLEEFYVPELEPYIQPKKTEVGRLLRRVSDIPGRLNVTAMHAMDENSDTGSDEEEESVVDGYCTQLALAELLGSQEFDITRAHRSMVTLDLTNVPDLEEPETSGLNVTLEAASGFWLVHPAAAAGSNSASPEGVKKVANARDDSEKSKNDSTEKCRKTNDFRTCTEIESKWEDKLEIEENDVVELKEAYERTSFNPGNKEVSRSDVNKNNDSKVTNYNEKSDNALVTFEGGKISVSSAVGEKHVQTLDDNFLNIEKHNNLGSGMKGENLSGDMEKDKSSVPSEVSHTNHVKLTVPVEQTSEMSVSESTNKDCDIICILDTSLENNHSRQQSSLSRTSRYFKGSGSEMLPRKLSSFSQQNATSTRQKEIESEGCDDGRLSRNSIDSDETQIFENEEENRQHDDDANYNSQFLTEGKNNNQCDRKENNLLLIDNCDSPPPTEDKTPIVDSESDEDGGAKTIIFHDSPKELICSPSENLDDVIVALKQTVDLDTTVPFLDNSQCGNDNPVILENSPCPDSDSNITVPFENEDESSGDVDVALHRSANTSNETVSYRDLSKWDLTVPHQLINELEETVPHQLITKLGDASSHQVAKGFHQNASDLNKTVPYHSINKIDNTLLQQNVNECNETVPCEDVNELDETVLHEDINELNKTDPFEDVNEMDETVPHEDVNELNKTVPIQDVNELDETVPHEDVNELNKTDPFEDINELVETAPHEDPNELNKTVSFEDINELDESAPHEDPNELNKTVPFEDINELDESAPHEDPNELNKIVPFEDINELDESAPHEDPNELNKTVPFEDINELDETAPHEDPNELNKTVPFEDINELDETAPHEDPNELNKTVPFEDINELDETVPHEDINELNKTVPYEDIDEASPHKGIKDPDETIPHINLNKVDDTVIHQNLNLAILKKMEPHCRDSCLKEAIPLLHGPDVITTSELPNQGKLRKLSSQENLIVNDSLNPNLTAGAESRIEDSDAMHAKFMYDWSSLLASGEESDITITVMNGEELNAHTIVILARCSQLYKEIKDSKKHVTWDKVSYNGGYVFLVYLYTGKCSIKTKDDPLWMDVFDLALKYNCEDLVSHLESLYKVRNSPVIKPMQLNTELEVSVPRSEESAKRLDSELEGAKIDTTVKSNLMPVQTSTEIKAPAADSHSQSSFITPKSKRTSNIGNKNIVRRCLNLSPINKTTPLNVNATSETSQSAGTNFKSFQSSDNGGRHADKATRNIICGSQSPDLFDSTHSMGSISYITTPPKSPLTTPFLQKSPIDKSLKDLSIKPIIVDGLKVKESTPQALCSPYNVHALSRDPERQSAVTSQFSTKIDMLKEQSQDGCSWAEQHESDDLSHHVEETEFVKDMDSEQNTSAPDKEKDSHTKFGEEEDKEMRDNDVIDLTGDNSDNSLSSNASAEVDNAGTKTGSHYHTPDSNSVGDDMECLRLADSEESLKETENNVSNGKDVCKKQSTSEIVVDITCPSPVTASSFHEDLGSESVENEEHSYISNVWDDFDDVGCGLPYDCPKTPAKCTRVENGRSATLPSPKNIVESRHESTAKRKNDLDAIDMCPKSGASVSSALLSSSESHKKNPSFSPTSPIPSTSMDFQLPLLKGKNYEKDIPATASSVSDNTLVKLRKEFDDSGLWREEFEPVFDDSPVAFDKTNVREVAAQQNHLRTPQHKTSARKTVTPMPNYKEMPSPDLKKELEKYGIKPISRRKAVTMLEHVYEKTHPLVTDSEADSSYCDTPQQPQLPQKTVTNKGKTASGLCKKVLGKNQKNLAKNMGKEPKKAAAVKKKGTKKATTESINLHVEGEEDVEDDDEPLNSSQNSISSEGSELDCVEESMMLGIADNDNAITATQQGDLVSQVVQFITSDPELHQKILLYEPFFVEDLQASLKANGVKCNMNNLIDILDNQVTIRCKLSICHAAFVDSLGHNFVLTTCITFRTHQGQRSRVRKRKCKRKSIGSPSKSPKRAKRTNP